ncbi:MAG: hypothetical protein ACW98D_20065 [Promethearchaeota archaeon]|jgi:hypothetical protein
MKTLDKSETTKLIKDVLSGNHGHTHIGINVINNDRFEVDTNINSLDMEINFQHQCNDITDDEVEEYFVEALQNLEVSDKV